LKSKFLIISLLFTITAIIFIAKLFFIQVVETKYKLSADNNTLRFVTQYPTRGKIFDRNDKILVSNKVYFDLKVVPKSLSEFDTTALCRLLKTNIDEFKKTINEEKQSYRPITIKKQIDDKEFALIEEQLYKFPGFYFEKRTIREYQQLIASHVLGYIAEVNPEELKNDNYYEIGDFIGKSGIERKYETQLRGKKGVNILIVDVLGREQGSYRNGKYDENALAGLDLTTTIDADLQAYGEKLLTGKIGSIVAIEPSTGELLAIISGPTYSPDLFIGKNLSENYKMIEQSKGKPLINRALTSLYPPGSTFKLINGLIGLQKEVITTQTVFVTNGYDAGNHIVKDHISGSVDFQNAIQHSSNAYYCHVFKRIISDPKFTNYADAYEDWKMYVESFGLGVHLNSDLDNEKKGILYPASYFDRYYGKARWNYNTVISLAIGQGELGFTPLQIANMTAVIANRGYYITPHVIKKIQNNKINKQFIEKKYSKVSEEYFKPVIEAMEKVVSQGTGYSAYTPGIDICGKTGTVQNPHGADHSVFVAFAPKNNPKIAISVYIENAGFGSTWAAPIAGLMIEKYLNDTTSKPWVEKQIIETDLINQTYK
jgi:penicillin-binding protein 2